MAQQGKKKKGGAAKVILAVLLVVILTAGGMALFVYREINGNGLKSGTEVTVSIPQGSGVAAIANRLKDAGVIRSAYLFRWYVGQKGVAGKLQYGDFTLQTGANAYDAIIAVLSQYAKADTVRITIPEGTTAIAIARKMEEAGLCSAEDFLKEANEGDFSAYTFWQYVPEDKDAPDRFMKCEGYLFPDTYEFFVGENASSVVKKFLSNGDSKISEKDRAQAKKLGYSMYEVMTIASIIQKEAGSEKQMKTISSVIHNRLSDKTNVPSLGCQSTSDYITNFVKPNLSSTSAHTADYYMEYYLSLIHI